jgi:L-lactate dehydrogenase complex protein LldG
MSSRDQILAALRTNKQPFATVPPRPANYLPVTQISGSVDELVARFTAELERLTGKVYRVPDPAAAIQHVLTLLGDDKSVITWPDLPLPNLAETLDEHQIKRVIPQLQQNAPDERFATLQNLEPIRVGITGADGALATTGTLVLASNATQARLVSLLPIVHIALLPLNRLYANMEVWLAAQGKQAITQSNGVTFITGPSRTSDIEMQTILGVHGPREVHVIIYPL